jgi:superfamily II DNA or RNA helicase
MNIPKLNEEDLKMFGLIIVDECHLISTEYFSKSLQYVTPRYLIGLSATPYRNDGMDKIMDLYFGKERIVRNLQIEHVVYKIQTSFVPPIIQMRNGQLDWNHIIDAQSNHRMRNDMIVRLVEKFPERHILILCKRKEQGNHLLKEIQNCGHHATRLMGNDKNFDKDARVVIATINKAGVGFSHDILDTLILAADVEEYYIQYLGRITRRPDVQPIIFDIIDQNPTLQRHFQTRRKVYKEIGGKIVDFKREYPDFNVI